MRKRGNITCDHLLCTKRTFFVMPGTYHKISWLIYPFQTWTETNALASQWAAHRCSPSDNLFSVIRCLLINTTQIFYNILTSSQNQATKNQACESTFEGKGCEATFEWVSFRRNHDRIPTTWKSRDEIDEWSECTTKREDGSEWRCSMPTSASYGQRLEGMWADNWRHEKQKVTAIVAQARVFEAGEYKLEKITMKKPSLNYNYYLTLTITMSASIN